MTSQWCHHTLIMWSLASERTLSCLTAMCKHSINFLYNPGHAILWCLEVVLVANVREDSTQENDWARVWCHNDATTTGHICPSSPVSVKKFATQWITIGTSIISGPCGITSGHDHLTCHNIVITNYCLYWHNFWPLTLWFSYNVQMQPCTRISVHLLKSDPYAGQSSA